MDTLFGRMSFDLSLLAGTLMKERAKAMNIDLTVEGKGFTPVFLMEEEADALRELFNSLDAIPPGLEAFADFICASEKLFIDKKDTEKLWK